MTTLKQITFTTLFVFTMAPMLLPTLPQHAGLIYYSTKYLLKLALYGCLTVAVTKWIFGAIREMCQDVLFLATIPAGVAMRLIGFLRNLFPSKSSPVPTSSNVKMPAAVSAESVVLAEEEMPAAVSAESVVLAEEEEEEDFEEDATLLLKSAEDLQRAVLQGVDGHQKKWREWCYTRALLEHLSEDESKYEEYAYSTLKWAVEYYTPGRPKCRETYYLLSEVYEIIEQGK